MENHFARRSCWLTESPLQRRWLVALAALAAFGAVGKARAQLNEVTPTIVIEPWSDQPHWADTFDEILLLESGHQRGSDDKITMWYWDSTGRIKVERDEDEPVFALGYTILTLEVNSENSAYDGQFNDLGLVGVGMFRDLVDDWEFSITGGIGTANDGHWETSDALYGVAGIDAAFIVDDTSKIHLGVSYWGNRPIFPDVPIPYVSWDARLTQELRLLVGLPDSAIEWEPVGGLHVSGRYVFPVDVEALVRQELGAGFSVYGQYVRTLDGFHDADTEHRRVFHEIDRVSVGVRWITSWLDVSVALGYILSQEFRSGFDLTDLEDLGDINDRFYLGLVFQGYL